MCQAMCFARQKLTQHVKTLLSAERLHVLFFLIIKSVQTLVATIHFSRITGEWSTDFLIIHLFCLQREDSFCPFTYSLGDHGRTLHSLTPFTRTVATKARTSAVRQSESSICWTFHLKQCFYYRFSILLGESHFFPRDFENDLISACENRG